MAVDSNFYKQKKTKSIYWSLGLLLFVILGTWGLFFYNGFLEKENDQLVQDILQREKSIEDLRKDKNIEAYYIYNLSENILEDLYEKSQISDFVEHALRTMVRYDMTFEAFSYSNGEISLNGIAESNDEMVAYQKLAKFIDEYNKSETSLFELQNIDNFSWQNDIKFPMKFIVK